MACCIAPALDVGVAPCAEGVLQGAVLAEERVAHGVVALCCVGGTVVVVCWGGVGAWVVRHVFVLVGPFFGDVAVVVFEVWGGGGDIRWSGEMERRRQRTYSQLPIC